MLFRKKGTNLLYDVKPSLIPLFQGNEAYEEVIKEDKATEAEEKPKKAKKK